MADTVKAIYQAWLDHIVIVFPGQQLSQEDLIRATSFFGAQGMPRRPRTSFRRLFENPAGIMLISNIARTASRSRAARRRDDVPPRHDPLRNAGQGHAALFVEIPDRGGNTLFASGYAAYDTLDPAVRNKLEGRKAIHHYNYGSTQKGDGKGTEAFGQCMHPFFRTHEDTKRKAVYVNRLMTVGVVDMPQEESNPLLQAVFDHAEKREFVSNTKWRLGDLLLWDNRCSSHARTDFPPPSVRLMLRTTVTGDVRPY